MNHNFLTENTLKIAYIDAGQGDSALIREPNGGDILIDGGKPAADPSVAVYLRAQQGDGGSTLVGQGTPCRIANLPSPEI